MRGQSGLHENQPVRFAITILLALLAAVFLRNAWVSDDAYISFRVIDNFINGYGLTWNVAERVQVYTNPLWVLLLSGFYGITRDIFYTSIFVSFILTILAAWILAFKAASSYASAAIALLMLVFSKAFVDYTSSGLETPLTFLLLSVFFWFFYTREPNSRTFFWLCLISSLGVVNRMDIALLYAPALIYSFSKIPKKKAVMYGLAGFAPLILWEFFAIVYYGFPFPNTYYAKLHTGLPAIDLFRQGLMYFLDSFSRDPLTLISIFASIVIAWSTRNSKTIAAAIGIILYMIYTAKIGGDFMSGRFFAAPLLCAAAIIAATITIRINPQFWLAIISIIMLGFISTDPTLLAGPYAPNEHQSVSFGKGIVDERKWYYPATGLLFATRDQSNPKHSWFYEGLKLKESGEKVVVNRTVGFIGFAAGPTVHIIDIYGLGDPLLARLPIHDLIDWRIGHFSREVPWGYEESIRNSNSSFEDTSLAAYYQKLKLVISGDITDIKRFKEIVRFNLGFNDYLLNEIRNPRTIFSINYSDINVPKPQGTNWKGPGNIVLTHKGLLVTLDRYYQNRLVEISVDHNDDYRLVFFDDSVRVAESNLGARRIASGGLRVDTVAVDLLKGTKGFNKVEILPTSGDNRYSVGHIRILDSK